MARFFKENLALITGLSLPILLIVFFSLAGRWSERSVSDPQHDLVFAADYYPNMDNRNWVIAIESGKIVVRKRAVKDPNAYGTTPRLYLFDHGSLTARKLDIDFDKLDSKGVVSSAALEDLNRHLLVPGPVAPDGYRMEYNSRGGSGFLGEIFGMSNARSYYSLVKESRVVPLKSLEAIYSAEPIAWVSMEKSP